MLQRVRHFPNNFVLSGNVVTGNSFGIEYRGLMGDYWSSTKQWQYITYSLLFGYTDNINYGDYTGMVGTETQSGSTVRCILTSNTTQ